MPEDRRWHVIRNFQFSNEHSSEQGKYTTNAAYMNHFYPPFFGQNEMKW